MSVQNDILKEQIAACHDQENWFVPIKIALDGLTVEMANWKENEGTNSIWEIVNHLSFWNERYLYRFQGVSISEEKIDNDATFHNPTAEEWESSVSRIDTVMEEWKTIIDAAGEEKLSSFREGTNDPWWSIIANVNIHNAYHIGQIVQIRKQQGSWTPRQW